MTGATGFIGRNLVKPLVERGFEVHATSRRLHKGEGKIRWWQADVVDANQAEQVFAAVKPHVVFHLAGRPGADPGMALVLSTYHSLATGTVNVLVNAASHRCERVVLFASCNEPFETDLDFIPGSPYAAAKWVGTVYARMFHKLYATPVVTLRPFMVYGPGQAREKLIPSVADALLHHRQPLLTSCRIRGDWVYIDDVVDACITAMSAPSIEGREIDIGTGTLISQRTLVEMFVEATGRNIIPAFGAIADRPHEHEVVANTELAMASLGWKARTSLEDGLRRTWDWYSNEVTLVQS